jgi:Oxysterol-binding protein
MDQWLELLAAVSEAFHPFSFAAGVFALVLALRLPVLGPLLARGVVPASLRNGGGGSSSSSSGGGGTDKAGSSRTGSSASSSSDGQKPSAAEKKPGMGKSTSVPAIVTEEATPDSQREKSRPSTADKADASPPTGERKGEKSSKSSRSKSPVRKVESAPISIAADSKDLKSNGLSASAGDDRSSKRRGHRRTGSGASNTSSNSSKNSPSRRASKRDANGSDARSESRRNIKKTSSSASLVSNDTSSKRSKSSKRELRVPDGSGNDLLLPESKQLRGWFELGRKHRAKVSYKKMWFALKYRGWLLYWEDNREHPTGVCGYIKLHGCDVYEDLTNWDRPKLIIQHEKKHIFHRKGPEDTMPIAQKKEWKNHKRSKTVRLLCVLDPASDDDDESRKVTLDESLMRRWVESLKEQATGRTRPSSSVTSEESSSECTSESDDMYASISEMDEQVPMSEQTLAVTDPDHGKVMMVRSRSGVAAAGGASATSAAEPDSSAKGERAARKRRPREPVDFDPRTSTELVKTLGPGAGAQSEQPDVDVHDLQSGISNDQDSEKRDGLMKLLANAVGLDITTIAVPVTYNEPTSFLQRMCEVVQYYDLLNKADMCTDSSHSVAFITAFALSFYHTNIRTTKPFNPLLGETFEYQAKNDGSDLRGDKPYTPNVPFKFVAEQVSHHPPIGASFCFTEHFEFTQTQGLKTKFGGNSLAAESLGSCEVHLKRTGKRYKWGGVKTVIHNVIIGTTWVDHYGEMEIIDCDTNIVVAKVDMKKCGWFGKNRSEVRAWIVEGGSTKVSIKGHWDGRLTASAVKGPEFVIPGDKSTWPDPKDSTCIFRICDDSRLDSSNKWKLPRFAQMLSYLNDGDHGACSYDQYRVDIGELGESSLLKNGFYGALPKEPLTHSFDLPATDARLRPDRASLEVWDTKRAGAQKRGLEEMQRKRKKEREARSEEWKVRFFTPREDDSDFLLYEFTNEYDEKKHESVPDLW